MTECAWVFFEQSTTMKELLNENIKVLELIARIVRPKQSQQQHAITMKTFFPYVSVYNQKGDKPKR
jgi:hypothetical protein